MSNVRLTQAQIDAAEERIEEAFRIGEAGTHAAYSALGLLFHLINDDLGLKIDLVNE